MFAFWYQWMVRSKSYPEYLFWILGVRFSWKIYKSQLKWAKTLYKTLNHIDQKIISTKTFVVTFDAVNEALSFFLWGRGANLGAKSCHYGKKKWAFSSIIFIKMTLQKTTKFPRWMFHRLVIVMNKSCRVFLISTIVQTCNLALLTKQVIRPKTRKLKLLYQPNKF